MWCGDVPLRVEGDDVVRSLERGGEWVIEGVSMRSALRLRFRELRLVWKNVDPLAELRLYCPIQHINHPHIANHHPLFPRLLTQVCEVLVPLGEAGEVLPGGGSIGEDGRDEGLGRDRGVSLREGGGGGNEAGENGEFTGDIGARKIIPRVGLLRGERTGRGEVGRRGQEGVRGR
jgi:hypothetical protein